MARHVQLDAGQSLSPHRNRSPHASSWPTPVEAPAQGLSPRLDRAETGRAAAAEEALPLCTRRPALELGAAAPAMARADNLGLARADILELEKKQMLLSQNDRFPILENSRIC